MKVKELIELLERQNPEDLIVMSKDAEGNTFVPFSDLSVGSYAPGRTWYGYFGLRADQLTDRRRAAGCSEEDVINGQNAICLWPVN